MKEKLSTIQMLELMDNRVLTVREICALAAEKYPHALAEPKHLNRKLKTLQMSPTVEIERGHKDGLTAYRLVRVSPVFRNRSAGSMIVRKNVRSGVRQSQPYVSHLNAQEQLAVEQMAMFNQLLAGVRDASENRAN